MTDQFIGEIRIFGGSFAPEDWAFCDGSLLSISDYSELFSLIGNTYGGDGVSTFAVPDLRGRVPVDAGAGAGLSTYQVGETGGAESVSLITGNLPPHNHIALGYGATGNQDQPQNAVWAAGAGAGGTLYTTNAPSLPMSSSVVGMTGHNVPHDNVMPYLAISFIIALHGMYPSRA